MHENYSCFILIVSKYEFKLYMFMKQRLERKHVEWSSIPRHMSINWTVVFVSILALIELKVLLLLVLLFSFFVKLLHIALFNMISQ